MFLTKLSINRPVMITMIISVFIVFGVLAYFGLSLNLMPEADLPFITVQTIYPGAGPQETETQITKKIEDAVSTISKIDYVESYSMENVSMVILAFELDKAVDVASQEVKQKVDGIMMNLPADAEQPTIDKFDPSAMPIMSLVFSGNLDSRELFDFADKRLKDLFSQIEGVAKVDLTGGEEREIKVELDDRVVFQNMISLPQLSQILAAQNLDMPAGQFQQNEEEYSVRMKGELQTIEQLNEIDIPTPFGVKKLRQLAEVKDTSAKVRKRSIYFNNINNLKQENVITLKITKTSEGNPVTIAQEVKKKLPMIRNELPRGTSLEIIEDDSRFIKSSVQDTLNNVILGIIFTGIVLLFFLHDLRSTLIVAIAMPTSIISTFLAMQIADFSINILSLMGLSTSVGILVTNSVVVLENIFRHKELGHDRRNSASIGTSEIAVAVIASTLTNIVVFVPLAMMQTIAGQFIKEFALTVAFATIFSLLISFTITPMMASIILPEKKKKHPLGDKMENMFHKWEKAYQRHLTAILKNKGRSIATISIAFLMLILTFIFVAPQLGFEFMASMDQGNIRIDFELPEGYNLQQTAEMYEEIENRLKKYDEIKHFLVSLGSAGWTNEAPNLAQISVKLVDVEKRERSSEEMVSLFIQELADIPNAKFKVAISGSVGGGDSDLEFYLQGQEMSKLNQITDKLLTESKDIPGLLNFDSSSRPGKPEITLLPKREKMSQMNVTVYDLALILRTSVEGLVSTQYKEAGNEYDIRLSLSEESVDTPQKIKNIPIITQKGAFRISQLADVQFTEGSTMIVHRDKFKTIKFTGDVAEGFVQSGVMNSLMQIQQQIDLPSGYQFNWGGSSEMMQENNREMGKAFLIAILLTYMLLAAILESFTKPILILLTLPLAMIGVILSIFITGGTLNMISMMAVIMLLGIVVNAAILLLDYTQMLREQGKTTKTALIEACPTKFKPIIMSTVAIIMGMLPLALGVGSSGVEIRQPLGIVSIGGLIVSTVLTLFVIPAFYFLTTKEHVKKVKEV